VIFFVATIALAVIVIVSTKGSFERLSRLRFRMLWLLFLGLAVQIALEVVEFPKDRMEDVGFCVVNRSVRGMTLIAIGVALNVLVIALNQGMPTKDDVRERNGREARVPIEQTVKHRPQEDDDLLVFLGDVITAPGFPNQQLSIGDIVMGFGIVDLCFEGSRVPRRRGGASARPASRAQPS